MKKKSTILVVDDIKTNIEILIELLGDMYDVIVALDGQSALEIADEEDIDLILLDIMMPNMDGYEVCQILKSKNNTQHIPIIFITAKTDDESIEKAFKIGGIDYVTKPFRPRELLARVKTQLHLRHLQSIEMEHNKQIAFSALIDNIAHQWRQPLSIISTSASGMSVQKELGMLKETHIDKYCDEIVKQSEYLSSIIEKFTTLTNDSSVKTMFNFKTLIDKNYKLFFNDINNDITVITNIDNNIELYGYYHQILQVILPIITNSKNFIQENQIDKKLIFIDAIKSDEQLVINIYDNGLGIATDDIDKIFEPYFTTKHQSQGKGLGLYVVHNLITNILDGVISVSNKTFEYDDVEYYGANFEIIIPIDNGI